MTEIFITLLKIFLMIMIIIGTIGVTSIFIMAVRYYLNEFAAALDAKEKNRDKTK